MAERFTLLILSALLFTCESDQTDQVDSSRLVQSASYELHLPTGNAPNSWAQKFYDRDEANFLYYLDKDTQELLIYSITGRTLNKKIKLASDGPDGFGPSLSFSVKSPDSIYFSVNGAPTLYIADESGRSIGTLDIDWSATSKQVPDYTALRSRYYTDLSFDGQYVYIPQRVPYRGVKPAEIEHQPIARYDELTGLSELLPFDYPKEYWEASLPDNLTLNSDARFLYFGFTGDHNIYRVDKQNFSVKKVHAKSRFAPDDIPNTRNIAGPDDVMLYDAMTPRYTALLPDKYRNVFYRIVCLPPSDISVAKQKFNQLHYYPDRFAIMVLDSELRVLHEKEFAERRYFPHGIFVNREGIHVPRTHPEYMVTTGNEDVMIYDIYTIGGLGK